MRNIPLKGLIKNSPLRTPAVEHDKMSESERSAHIFSQHATKSTEEKAKVTNTKTITKENITTTKPTEKKASDTIVNTPK